MLPIPLYPPRDWFTPPANMASDAGCVVEDSGRVFGYLCHWGSILMDGSGDRWTPPRSKSSYSYAHTGDTKLADGEILKTANLGGDVGHAPQGDPWSAQDFYENTQTQLARVRYGEDAHGVWFAGSLWPTVSELDVARLRASARSGHWAAIGDWRDLRNGKAGYELVGACLVNVPGLKYARADKAATGVLSFNPLAFEGNMSDVYVLLDATERVASSGAVAVFEPVAPATSVSVSGVLAVEGMPTEDGRLLAEGSVEWRELPLPLYAKLENTPGHDDAMLIGRIDKIWRDETDPKRVMYEGTAFPNAADEYGARVLEAINNETLRGVSIDGITGPQDAHVDDQEMLIMSRIVIAGATLTPMPAIGEATVTLSKTTTGETKMDTQTAVEAAVEEAPVDVPGDTEAATDDRWQAVQDQLATVSDRLEYLIGVVESSQMNARYQAAEQRA